MRAFSGRVVVIKYGGNALAASIDQLGDDADALTSVGTLATFAEDIVLLRSVGILPVVVHGGGPQIGEMMQRLGKSVEFLDGLRVTDAETLDIARMVLVGKVNREIVSAINVHAPLAVGLSGEDAHLITAEQRSAQLGFVGDILRVDPTMVRSLLSQGLIPVVATVGIGAAGQAYNINADTAAGAIAAALSADKLVYLTDVAGVQADRLDPTSLIGQIDAHEIDRLINDGVVDGGMIPKVEAAAKAVRDGVGRAHVLDGRVPHALLVELFTDSGVGTMVSP
ncbi:MAG: acetylglutamate kinase [Acidimicrobiales bacterium]